MRIQGGNNPHSTASVDARGRLATAAVTQPDDNVANEDGRSWSAYFSVAPDAGEHFFYLANTGDNDLKITDIRASSSAANTLSYEAVTGSPVLSGEEVVQVTSRNLASSAPALATVSAGTSMAGLTADGVLFFEELPVANKREKLSATSNIIIPKGKAIAFRALNTSTVLCVVSLVQADA